MVKKYLFLVRNIMLIPLNFVKGNSIHLTTRLSSNVKLSRTKVGRNTYIACNSVIVNSQIGNYCSIAPNVQIGGMEHSYWWYSTSTSLSDHCKEHSEVKIGNDVWIAGGAMVKQGVKIGNGSVIGAMSFVNNDVPENSIVLGIPAKIYKNRMAKQTFEELQKTRFWSYPPEEAKRILESFEKRNYSERKNNIKNV